MQNPQQTIISQYRSSPIINALIGDWNADIDPSANVTAFYNLVWNVATAVGYGLDVLGRIVGVTRIIVVGTYNTQTLSDAGFRTLILAKALANICDGSIPGLNAILMLLFPNAGDNYVEVTGLLTVTVHLGFTPTATQVAILELVFPAPVGVTVTYPSPSGASLAVTIPAGSAASGKSMSHTFAASSATATGGSGSYAYAWTETDDAAGTWAIANPSSESATLSVSSVANGVTTAATLKCTVTDTITGLTADDTANYSFDNTTSAGAFTVSIGPGARVSGGAFYHQFSPNGVTVNGGSGSYTYQWNLTFDDGNEWIITGGSTASVVPYVVIEANTYATAQLTCTVTDTVSGLSVTSGQANYTYNQTV